MDVLKYGFGQDKSVKVSYFANLELVANPWADSYFDFLKLPKH